jgi:hypothetical protein
VAGSTVYGTTTYGAVTSPSACPIGCGTLFAIDRTSSFNHVTLTFQTVYEFRGASVDGAQPWSSVVADPSGDVFGLTLRGGTTSGAKGILYEYVP